MNKKKWTLTALAVLLLAAGALTWLLCTYHIVDMHLYPKAAEALDLTDRSITAEHYENIRRKLPQTDIIWNVPLSGTEAASDSITLKLTTLTQEDVLLLEYLPALQRVDARGCTDYAALYALAQQRPQVELLYNVTVDGRDYPQDAEILTVSTITVEELALLPYLPELEQVVCRPGGNMENAPMLRTYCQAEDVDFCVELGGQVLDGSVKELTLTQPTAEDLSMIGLLTSLESLCMEQPQADAGSLLALPEQLPDTAVTWQVEVAGQLFSSEDTEIDLSQVVIGDLTALEQVENAMEYLPNAEKVIFGLCGIDSIYWGSSKAKDIAVCPIENEDMAAYRDRVREDYKVVWTVRLGPDIALRTDKDNFMPGHFGIGRFFDEHAYNLRYCEDMVCIDIGHMTVSDISFVAFMPHLKYLILAWTEVQYIEPIRNCKELVFLELDNSCIRDYSPLVDCTALEDLNIGDTHCDITPILEMTWLKNLNMIFCSGLKAYQCSQALPNTRVVASGAVTVGGNWRKLDNYYAMRDCLGMYYMN